MKDAKQGQIPRRGYLYVVAAALLWAVSGTSGKFLFHHGVTPYELVQLRVTLSAAVLFLWLAVRHRDLLRISRRDLPYFLVLGIAGMAAVHFTYFFTISKIDVAIAILLEYLAPVFIALYSVLIVREKLTRTITASVALSFLGCYLAVGAYSIDILTLNWLGIAVGICAGITYACYSILAEKGMRKYSPWTVVFYALLFAALFWNIALRPLSSFIRPYSGVDWFWIVYISVLGTAVPFGLYTAGISLIRSTRASVTATLEPIAAAFIAWLFLGEKLQIPQMLGGVLVIAAVILLQVRCEYDENTSALIRGRNNEW